MPQNTIVDESYVTSLEYRVEELETMLFCNNAPKSNSSFVVMNTSDLLKESCDLYKQCEKINNKLNFKAFHAAFLNWKLKAEKGVFKFFFKGRLTVSFEEWYKNLFRDYSTCSGIRAMYHPYPTIMVSRLYLTELTEVWNTAKAAKERNRSFVIVCADELDLLQCAKSYCEKWKSEVEKEPCNYDLEKLRNESRQGK